ncbi:MAG: murein biosynthesis integral membrane protein MurJ, partial [Gammaproteobacteria bacterium]
GFIGDEDKYDLAVHMLRITFPYLLFISLTAFAGGILNTYGRFAVPAFTPVLLNVSLIICAIWLAPHMETPVTALAWGVFIAGAVQLLFQLPFLLRLRLFPKPKVDRNHEGVKRILQLMIPTLFAVSVSQSNLIVDMLMASFLETGSISWLYYSDRLMEFPLGVFGVALATVILPSLSAEHAGGASEKFSHLLDWALRWSILVSIPASLGLILLAGPMLTTIFQYGEFTPRFVEMASLSLVSYAIGLSGFILIKVLASGYFSRQDTKTPVKIGVVAMFSNIILNLLLIGPLAHAGLALATSLASFINAGLLYVFLRKKKVFEAEQGWGGFLFKVILACSVMSVLLFSLVPDVEVWLDWSINFRVLHLGLWIVLGAITYFSVLWISGLRLRDMALDSQQV